jgi:hypothetical protein
VEGDDECSGRLRCNRTDENDEKVRNLVLLDRRFKYQGNDHAADFRQRNSETNFKWRFGHETSFKKMVSRVLTD